MDEIDQQSFDVGTVLILICHDHQPAIAQCLQVIYRIVLLLVLQAQDLDDVVNFSVLQNLLVSSFTNVKYFSFQGENTVLVTANNTKS